MRCLLVSTLMVSVALPAAAQRRDLDYSARREASISTEGAQRVVIEAHAGSLRIEGKAGLREVRAHGTARAGSEERLEEVRLLADREGSTVRILVDIPDSDDGRWSEEDRAALDLVVEVPKELALEVGDGSGEAEIIGVGALEVDDGSGSLRIEDVDGELSVTDGSGDVIIQNVRGDVRLRDGSGSLEVADVRGSIVVAGDGSGEIDVRNVTGGVHVRNDGSGSIQAREIGGDFVVDTKGSGGIRFSGVKGEVRIPRDERGRRLQ